MAPPQVHPLVECRTETFARGDHPAAGFLALRWARRGGHPTRERVGPMGSLDRSHGVERSSWTSEPPRRVTSTVSSDEIGARKSGRCCLVEMVACLTWPGLAVPASRTEALVPGSLSPRVIRPPRDNDVFSGGASWCKFGGGSLRKTRCCPESATFANSSKTPTLQRVAR